MSTVELLEFVRERNSAKYEQLVTVARESGVAVPREFGAQADIISPDPTNAELEIVSTALTEAVSAYDEIEIAIMRRLKRRDKLRLFLNIVTTVSAGSLLTMLGINKSVPPWNFLFALTALSTSVGTVVVDHLGIKTQAFWEKLSGGTALRENANSLLLRIRLSKSANRKETQSLISETLEIIEQLRLAAKEIGLELIKRD